MAIIIKDILAECVDILSKARVESPLADAEILLANIMQWPRWRIWANTASEISEDKYRELIKAINKRAQRVPLPYITGFKEFYGYEFIVDENVLIPRPETELLVEEAIKYIKENGIKNAVEIGIGSGAITVSLALETNANIFAVDISPNALLVAKKNITKHGVDSKIRLFEGDLLTPLIDNQICCPDIIIANLPYIPTVDRDTLETEVKDFEPGIALFSGDDGLTAIRRLITQSTKYCKEDTVLGIEFGIGQENAILTHLNANGWSEYKIIRDYSGIIRHIFAKFMG